MNDLYEKVCKGLDVCLHSVKSEDCVNCYYHKDYPYACRYNNKLDALALIRAQQSRIRDLETQLSKWEKYTGFLAAHGVLKEVKPDGITE